MTSVQPDLAARVAATRERLELDAEVWNPVKQPEQPREIAGLVVERRTLPGAGHNGADAEQMVLQEPDGHCWRFRLYGTVLQNELAGVGPGDVAAIRYVGWIDKPGAGDKDGYHLWSVTVDQGGDARPAARPAAPPSESPARREEDPDPPAAPAAAVRCQACDMLQPYHVKNCPLGEDDIPF